MSNPWLIAALSGAVGVLVSSLITLAGQYLERGERRKELLISKALEMAIHRAEFVHDAAKRSGTSAAIIDPAVNAETYYEWLEHLWKKGKLPEGARRETDQFLEKIGKLPEKGA